MKSLAPAEVRSEPATTPGMIFLDATGRRCVWPLSGAGAEMVCCGDKRVPGFAYCQPHIDASRTPAAQGRDRPPRIKV